jgi:hypothetical protein
MVGSGKREQVERDPHGASAVQKTTRPPQEPDLRRALDQLDPETAIESLQEGDRPTPVELVAPSLVDATAAGPGSTAIPISIPPPAVEVTRPSGEVEIERPPSAEALVATRVMPVMAAPRPDAVPSAPPVAPPPDEPFAEGRAPNPIVLKTRMARKITTLSDEVNECFADFRIGAGDWRIELTAPEGMSTGGGKHAQQRLRLQPMRPGHPMIVVGIVDPIEKTAELRDYDHMELLHRLRFDRSADITCDEWAKVLESCEVVLKLANIRSARTPAPPELVAQQKLREAAVAGDRTGRGRRSVFVLAVVVLALVVAAVGIWRVAALAS